jgi:hypothetical protein
VSQSAILKSKSESAENKHLPWRLSSPSKPLRPWLVEQPCLLEASHRSTKNDLPGSPCQDNCKGRYPNVAVSLISICVKDEAVSSSASSTTTPIILPPHTTIACSTSITLAQTSRTTRTHNVPAYTCDVSYAAGCYWMTTVSTRRKLNRQQHPGAAYWRRFFPLVTLPAFVVRIVASTFIVMREGVCKKEAAPTKDFTAPSVTILVIHKAYICGAGGVEDEYCYNCVCKKSDSVDPIT